VYLNGITITQAKELYNYRFLPETLFTYGNDATTIHITNAFWILDNGNMAQCDPTAADSQTAFMTRWSLAIKSQDMELYGRIHTEFCNVLVYLEPGVRLQIKFTKAKSSF
jgi:hypothetical protein